eukprot:gene5243-18473_t
MFQRRGPQGGNGSRPQGPKEPPVDMDAAANASSAAPGPCARCELTKTQFTKTMYDYQKAYRKKVTALRADLMGERESAAKLKKDVSYYKSAFHVHSPSMLVGVGLGFCLSKLLGLVKRRRVESGKGSSAKDSSTASTQDCCGCARPDAEGEGETATSSVSSTETPAPSSLAVERSGITGRSIVDSLKSEGSLVGVSGVSEAEAEEPLDYEIVTMAGAKVDGKMIMDRIIDSGGAEGDVTDAVKAMAGAK